MDTAQALLQKHFGFETFRPGQQAVIEALLENKGALAVFPTGAGKSLCYQLPALMLDGLTVIVSPLIALMKDQIDFLSSRGIAAARMDSSLNAFETRRVTDAVRDGTLKLLYIAPERFNNERFLSLLHRTKISLFAVDEAHCISEWGHNFRPDYLKLAEVARSIKAERILTLTATATPSVVDDICKAFGITPEAAIVTGFYRPNLNLATTPVAADARNALLLKRLQSRKPGPAIVYVTLQKTAERIAALLQQAGIPADAYHAGMEPEARSNVQERWMASERGIVIATIAFGMGIDKANVRYVYHYNLPKSLESYSQEIGRAGRDGEKSVVEMFVTPDDVPTLENFAYGDTPTSSSIRSLLQELLGGEEVMAFNLYDLSQRHDLRATVLKTAITYLELKGVLRQGTPYYAGYEFRPLRDVPEIVSEYRGEPALLVQAIFDNAKQGRTWYAVDADSLAETLGQERRRIVRVLEVLEENALIELRAADVRQTYTRLTHTETPEELTDILNERFARREKQEVLRLRQVLDLVTHAGCQTNVLISYFGETPGRACGHCTYCVTGKAQMLQTPTEPAILPADIQPDAFFALRARYPEALGEPRQAARFLCGLTSPALTRARLTRHALFGALATHRFSDVMEWAAGLVI